MRPSLINIDTPKTTFDNADNVYSTFLNFQNELKLNKESYKTGEDVIPHDRALQRNAASVVKVCNSALVVC